MTLAVAVVVLGGLYLGREVFVPIVLAVLLAFVIAPLVDLLRRLRMGRVPAVIAAVLVALGIILSLGTVIGLQVADLASDLPRYEQTVRSKVASLREGTIGQLPEILKRFSRQVEEATKETPPTATPSTATTPDPQPLPVEVHEPDPTPLQIARDILLPVIAPLATVGIVFVVLIFILLQREDLRDRMIRLFGAQDLHRTTVAMDDAARRLSRYFLIQLGLNAAFGVMISIGLWAIGVPSPLLWGIFAGLMRFVPYIGSIIAGALPVALAAAVDPGWSMALLTLSLFLITEPVMGHVIEPLVYGQSTGLSPFAVVMSAIFWTWLWGPIGLLLATPLTLCLVVLGRHVERLEFLDVLLGDRPALTPAENLYQRMLAGDPDEALDYAEQLLKERSLTSYYDDVVLAGLQLAANDASRGVLSGSQLERLKVSIQALVSDLSTHDDVEPDHEDSSKDPVAPPEAEEAPKKPPIDEVAPPPEAVPPAWREEGAVLCIAGRGPLDEAASTMLAQILHKHGVGAQVAPHEVVSRSAVMSLDVTGVKLVCISYLEISGSPAHLRYLLRRLRQRLPPGTPMLVGLWPSEDAILSDETMRKALGADYTVSSLRQAVIACLEVAARNGEPGPITKETPKNTPSTAPAVERAPLPA
jgi:predicted PurR-regulated permease PerM